MHTKLVSTNTLKVGDRYIAHGGIFIVRKIINGGESLFGEVHANISDFEGVAPGFSRCSIPEHWRTEWNQQGNSLAQTALIVGCPGCGDVEPLRKDGALCYDCNG